MFLGGLFTDSHSSTQGAPCRSSPKMRTTKHIFTDYLCCPDKLLVIHKTYKYTHTLIHTQQFSVWTSPEFREILYRNHRVSLSNVAITQFHAGSSPFYVPRLRSNTLVHIYYRHNAWCRRQGTFYRITGGCIQRGSRCRGKFCLRPFRLRQHVSRANCFIFRFFTTVGKRVGKRKEITQGKKTIKQIYQNNCVRLSHVSDVGSVLNGSDGNSNVGLRKKTRCRLSAGLRVVFKIYFYWKNFFNFLNFRFFVRVSCSINSGNRENRSNLSALISRGCKR